MWMTEWLKRVFTGGSALITVFCVAVGLFLVATVLAYTLKGKGIFGAIVAATGGGAFITLSVIGVALPKIFACFALLSVLGGALYLFLFCALSVRAIVAERKRRRAELGRRLQFTLPDRENSYIRARLNTALQTGQDEAVNGQINLAYARGLLAKIKEAPLSRAERLETDEMSKLMAFYIQKEKWSASDLSAVNDAFSRLLKLSAKYAV